jgi:hypothetical protein
MEAFLSAQVETGKMHFSESIWASHSMSVE